MESVGANNYFEHFGCEGEEISGGDVGSRKGCSVLFFFSFAFSLFSLLLKPGGKALVQGWRSRQERIGEDD